MTQREVLQQALEGLMARFHLPPVAQPMVYVLGRTLANLSTEDVSALVAYLGELADNLRNVPGEDGQSVPGRDDGFGQDDPRALLARIEEVRGGL